MSSIRSRTTISLATLILSPLLALAACGLGDDADIGSEQERASGADPGADDDGNDIGSDNGGGPDCGPTTCAAGQECCNESCGICTAPGEACIMIACDDGEPGAGIDPEYDPCAGKSCGDPCSICPPDAADCFETLELKACDERGECRSDMPSCDPDGGDDEAGVPCGPTTCAAGEVCCNESCGTCTPPGEACLTIQCEANDDAERTPVDESEVQCARNTGDSCASDADCTIGGCGGELCGGALNGGGIGICDCTQPQGVSCGCVEGMCSWYR